MQNPNPICYGDAYSARGRFQGPVGTLSFAVCSDDSHGAAPAARVMSNQRGDAKASGDAELRLRGAQ
jgi:hypothetical protein